MNLSSRKAKIKWQCRRGMLELDLLLERFLNQSLDTLTCSELDALDGLLTHSDPVLYSWLMDLDTPSTEEMVTIVELIKLSNHVH